MTRSTSETKALQSRSEWLHQSIFRLQVRPVAPNCFRRRTFHSEFGLARFWRACLNRVLFTVKKPDAVVAVFEEPASIHAQVKYTRKVDRRMGNSNACGKYTWVAHCHMFYSVLGLQLSQTYQNIKNTFQSCCFTIWHILQRCTLQIQRPVVQRLI